MSNWKTRLITERDELATKWSKLTLAIENKSVPADQVEVLTRQSKAMEAYLDILNERLS